MKTQRGFDERVTRLEGGLDNLSTRVTALEGRVDNLSTRVTALEGRVDNLSTRVTALEGRVDNLSNKVDRLSNKLDTLGVKVDLFIEESRQQRARQDEDMRALRADMNNLANYFRATNITVIIGVAAMVIAVFMK